MQVRDPEFDLTTATPHWGDNAEAVAMINAGAIIPAALERYLIRVLNKARKKLDPVADADLIRDIELFNKQEGQHAKMHAAYLVMLRDGGYPRIQEYEDAYAAELERYFGEETLAWNLAYAESFESSGAAMAEAWVNGRVAEICGDHGSVPMQLWMWHLAEEFEHRSVVHDVIERLYGEGEAYELRKQGADIGRPHFQGHSALAAFYIYEVDRAGMSPGEIAASDARAAEAADAIAIATGKRMLWVYERDYDPATIDTPRDYDAILARYS